MYFRLYIIILLRMIVREFIVTMSIEKIENSNDGLWLYVTWVLNEWEHFLNERLEWMIKIKKNEGTEWENNKLYTIRTNEEDYDIVLWMINYCYERLN